MNSNIRNELPIKQIKTDHKDLIQDIAFDFYGKRVATASLDHTVKIWSINDNNEWIFNEEIKINPGLYKVTWAHPEFGSLIAVACDRLAIIYEEVSFSSNKNAQSGWIRRQPAFNDFRSPITDMKFAPKHIGLMLVLCAQNGEVKIYECSDVFSTNAWNLVNSEVKIGLNSCSSCSWSTCYNLPILLALGSEEANSQSDKLVIFEFNENTRTYSKVEKFVDMITEPIRSLAFAPSIGKLYHQLAVASKALSIVTIKPAKEPHKYNISKTVLDPDVSAWRVCWNTVGSVLASAGDDRKVRLWKCNYVNTWRCFAEITGDSCSTFLHSHFNEHNLDNLAKNFVGDSNSGGGSTNGATTNSNPNGGNQLNVNNANNVPAPVWH